MKLGIAWILFGVPLVAAIFSGIGLCRNWNTVHHRFTQVSAIVLATLATVLACGATAYVQLVRPLRAFDYSVEASGMLLSFLGTVLGVGYSPLPPLVFFAGARRLGMDAGLVFSSGFHILTAPQSRPAHVPRVYWDCWRISRSHQ